MPLQNPPRRRQRRRRPLKNNVAKKQGPVPSFTKTRLRSLDHLYETRTKSTRIIDSQIASTDSAILSRKSSDSSVIYLGSFRKVPELVNLEDNDDNCETKMACMQQEIKSSRSQKMEPINTKTLIK